MKSVAVPKGKFQYLLDHYTRVREDQSAAWIKVRRADCLVFVDDSALLSMAKEGVTTLTLDGKKTVVVGTDQVFTRRAEVIEFLGGVVEEEPPEDEDDEKPAEPDSDEIDLDL